MFEIKVFLDLISLLKMEIEKRKRLGPKTGGELIIIPKKQFLKTSDSQPFCAHVPPNRELKVGLPPERILIRFIKQKISYSMPQALFILSFN